MQTRALDHLTVCGDDDVVRPRGVLLNSGDEATEFLRQVPSSSVRDVDGCGSSLDDLLQDLHAGTGIGNKGIRASCWDKLGPRQASYPSLWSAEPAGCSQWLMQRGVTRMRQGTGTGLGSGPIKSRSWRLKLQSCVLHNVHMRQPSDACGSAEAQHGHGSVRVHWSRHTLGVSCGSPGREQASSL